jgi:hypothetical protein
MTARARAREDRGDRSKEVSEVKSSVLVLALLFLNLVALLALVVALGPHR